jgi:hypothetical protein
MHITHNDTLVVLQNFTFDTLYDVKRHNELIIYNNL